MKSDRRALLAGISAIASGCATASILTLKGGRSATSAPVNTVAPTTTGSTPVGSVLTGTNGTWTGSPTFTYQWTSNGSNIGGATGSTYTTVTGDIGNAIARKVIGTNAFGSATATSSNSITVTSSAGTVGPNPLWNGNAYGTAGSAISTTLPVDPTRTTAKPACCWLQPGQGYTSSAGGGQRMWQNMVLGVAADALGGIASVQFFGDCATTTLTTPTIWTYTDPTGWTQQLLGYFITLNNAAFTAVTGSGTARIFANVTANDGTMQVRTIGFALDYSAGKSDWAMVLYPRTTRSDFDVTVGPSTGTYSTIAAAFNDARNHNAECPYLTCVDTANYAITNGNSGTIGTANAKGFATVTNAPGVKATFYNPSGMNLNDPSVQGANCWRPGWPHVHWLGYGLVFDLNTWTTMTANGQPWWDGIEFTNSSANWATNFNSAPQTGMGTHDDSSISQIPWHTDGVYQKGVGSMAYSLMARGLKLTNILLSPFDNTSFVFNTYALNISSEALHTPYNAISISCSVGGSTPTVNIPDTGFEVPTTTMVLTDNTGTQTITFGIIPSDGNPISITALAAVINARTGWTATVIQDTLGARFLAQTGGAVNVNTTQTFKAGNGYHTEWYHTNGPSFENILHTNNISLNCTWGSEIYNLDHTTNDIILKNNAHSTMFTSVSPASDKGGESGFLGGSSHCVAAEMFIDGGWKMGGTGYLDSYSLITRITTDYTLCTGAGGTFPTSAPTVTYNAFTLPNGATGPFPPATNIVLQSGGSPYDTDFQALVVNKTTGNFQPSSSILTSNLVPRLDTYDVYYNVRASSDIIGPVANGFSPPTYFTFPTP